MQLTIVLLSIGWVSPALAVVFSWSNAAGGTFNTPANWSPIGVPSSFDTAQFNLPNTYTVTVNASAGVNTLTQSQGDVTLNLVGVTLLLTNTTNNILGSAGQTSTLRVNGGAFSPGNLTVGGPAGSTSNLFLDSAVITSLGFGTFLVGSSGTGNFTLQNGATLTTPFGTAIGVNTSGVGTATVAGTGSLWTITNLPLRVGSSGTGTLNILSNGNVNAFGLEVGENLNSIGTVSMSGSGATFTTAGTANIGGTSAALPAASATLNIGTGATMNLNGTTNLRTNAKVNVSGGTLNLSTVSIATGTTFNWTAGTINFATAPTITASVLNTLLAGTNTLGANRTLSATAGTLSLTTPLILTGGQISAPTLSVAANMDISGFSTVTATNTLLLQSGTTIQLGNFSTLNATTSITNNGSTLALQGPLARVTGPFANFAGFVTGTGRFTSGMNNGANGFILVNTGYQIIIDAGTPTNAGTIELAGGTIQYSGTLTNLATGTISGRGVFRGSANTPGSNGLTNNGVLSFSGGLTDIFGDVNNAASGTIVAAGASTVTFYDDVVNNGEIRTAAGSRTVFFGSVTGAGPFTGTGVVELNGDLKPGNSPAEVTFSGNVTLNATAGLDIELGGTTKGSQYDSLTIAGAASLSGDLNVSLLGGFAPTSGQSFEILTAAGGIGGTFDAVTLPALAGGLHFNLAYNPTAVTLAVAGILGDYNRNGNVDAADYVLWRKSLSQLGPPLAADGNNNGLIDPADFTIWRANYGAPPGSGSGATGTGAIPEPVSLSLLALALVPLAATRPRFKWCPLCEAERAGKLRRTPRLRLSATPRLSQPASSPPCSTAKLAVGSDPAPTHSHPTATIPTRRCRQKLPSRSRSISRLARLARPHRRTGRGHELTSRIVPCRCARYPFWNCCRAHQQTPQTPLPEANPSRVRVPGCRLATQLPFPLARFQPRRRSLHSCSRPRRPWPAFCATEHNRPSRPGRCRSRRRPAAGWSRSRPARCCSRHC
jgi:T5SS/PEP-CTERM-associated repeat protein